MYTIGSGALNLYDPFHMYLSYDWSSAQRNGTSMFHHCKSLCVVDPTTSLMIGFKYTVMPQSFVFFAVFCVLCGRKCLFRNLHDAIWYSGLAWRCSIRQFDACQFECTSATQKASVHLIDPFGMFMRVRVVELTWVVFLYDISEVKMHFCLVYIDNVWSGRASSFITNTLESETDFI